MILFLNNYFFSKFLMNPTTTGKIPPHTDDPKTFPPTAIDTKSIIIGDNDSMISFLIIKLT